MDEITLPVMKIERFSTKDGEGIRTVVFLKGCPLRCAWCHNPEGLHAYNELIYEKSRCVGCRICIGVCENGVHSFENGHIIDREKCKACFKCADACPTAALGKAAVNMTVDEIVKAALRDKPFYGKTGGVTISGGEPMLHGEKTLYLLKKLKENGLNTAIETSGYFSSDFIPALSAAVDAFLYDVKDLNESRHINYTGVSNAKIIANLRELSALGANILIRRIVVPGVNDAEEDIERLKAFARSLPTQPNIEYLPYHSFGNGKYESVGMAEAIRFDQC